MSRPGAAVSRPGAAVGRLVLALACGALAGCGVPTGDAPQRIPASDVPYGLASPAPPTAAPFSAVPAAGDPRVYLVTGWDLLVARGRDVTGPSLEDRLGKLLADLAVGPTRQELAEQLSTALRPEVRLAVEAVENGVATISIAGTEGGQSTGESRRAVAQIVLTATSLPGIDAVRLSAGGEVVEAPLPSGELTSRPLTADDYAVLVAPPDRPR
jgi:hypothetical protein